jgi:hypothetical protein
MNTVPKIPEKSIYVCHADEYGYYSVKGFAAIGAGFLL